MKHRGGDEAEGVSLRGFALFSQGSRTRSRYEYLVGSVAASTALAESYVGLSLEH